MLLPLLWNNDSNCNLDKLIIRYNDHLSILAIENKCMELNSTLTFKKVDKEQISIAVKRLYSKKALTSSYIQLRSIKKFSDIFGSFLTKKFNECLDKGFFPDERKCAEVVPVYKKRINRGNNYRRVRILSNLSKLYKRCIQIQDKRFCCSSH